MTSANFTAWDLDPSAFDALPPEGRSEFLTRFAVLAPSSHNSQPWKFAVGPDSVMVTPDMTRALPHSDANHRQLYLSLGCAIENLAAAADWYGYQASVQQDGADEAPGWRLRLDGRPLPSASRNPSHRALAAAKRRTNRNPYEDRMPEQAFLDWMRGLSGPDAEVRIVSEEPLKSQVAAVVSDALIEAMDDDGFRHELSGYVKPNITRSETGMPMYGFGMPTPPSFLAPTLVKLFNVNRASRKQDEALLLKHTPVFAVIATRADGPAAWVEAGRLLERAMLEAETRGISTAPMAAAIQIGDHFRKLQSLLRTDLRPQAFFRIGYAAKAPKHSPRIPAQKVITRR